MLDHLLNQLLFETKNTSLYLFSAELTLSAGIVLMLLARLLGVDKTLLPPHWTALWMSLIAFLLTWFNVLDFDNLQEPSIKYFSNLLVFDRFVAWVRVGLLLFLIFVITLTVLSGIPDQEDGPDFYSLLIGATIGMLLMVGANNLLMVFLGIEMASVPSYAMVGFLKGRRQSSEAALKFVVYGAGAAGVMLYGLSLLAGMLGTTEFGEMAYRLQRLFHETPSLQNPALHTLALASLMIMVGFAFKLSVVPFHFWAPDAFHGASAEVGGFLSVASKAAAFALLVRFVIALLTPYTEALQGVYQTMGLGLGVIAAVSATFGNLAAYSQRNMKRLLAYSTIAHAGYMLMAIAALIVIQTTTELPTAIGGPTITDRSARAVEGLMYYLSAYLFMNLGAFAITALIRNEIFSEEIEDYAGLGYQCPVLAVGMAVCLCSLIGLPPLGGFVGKLFVFAALYDAGQVHGLMWGILVVAGLNTVFSLVYYMNVLRVMYLQQRPAGAKRVQLPATSSTGVYVMLLTLPLLVPLGIYPEWISRVANSAARALFH